MCACQHVCLCTTCVPGAHRVQKRTLFPQNQSYRLLWMTMWVLGKEPGPPQERQMVLVAEHPSSSI